MAKAQEPGKAAADNWDGVAVAKVDKQLQQPSSKAGLLYWVVSNQPTNYDMLIFRTLNQILKAPAHNGDHLAAAIRDELMPARSWCINFIDARTKWFDAAVRSAVSSGTIKQVDLPEASTRKQKLVSKLNMVPPGVEPPVFVPADLSRMDLGTALASTGFDTSVPTLFTLEGLIYYLPPAAARKLMKRIMQLSAPGSKSVASKGEAYKFGLQDSAPGVSSFLRAASKDANAEGTPGELRLNTVPPIAPFYSYATAQKHA
ncbi:S-adenosyl-L-methionine-dependent methyltransferase [Dunaliella salina]|uniref:S-adenosyl-L-methionine-dependent methyltransferase n=1 Tax=Dunaliella salina TaxID=3046 RepID=A0ABQ7H0E6_DUNSA|nr:S-adenosyl-L-methionine-dependent methyltransferase [Dunaliella salina]|eukprot:KAF5840324.1 S-adenosyl-L-methionine-dependent methyltransferase [Dunaliella salina]